MHPFSLEKTQEEQVVGGVASKITYFGGCTETGGGINLPGDPVTQAIPEDGNDPRPFPPEDWM